MSIYPTVLQNETLIHRDEDEATDVLAGDETAFESLFDRHKRLVGSIAARCFRRPEQIEETAPVLNPNYSEPCLQ